MELSYGSMMPYIFPQLKCVKTFDQFSQGNAYRTKNLTCTDFLYIRLNHFGYLFEMSSFQYLFPQWLVK